MLAIMYNIMCFIRYDIIIDTELKPWLIEVCAYQHHKYDNYLLFCDKTFMYVYVAVRLMHPLHWHTCYDIPTDY